MNAPSGLALAVAILRDAFPRQEFPDASVALYAQLLGDLDEAAVVDAVTRLVRRSTFLPSIAEIRQEVAEAELALPTVEEAWSLVNDPDVSVLSLPPALADSLKSVGGRYAVRMSEQPTVIRSQFVKDYAARRAQAVLEQMKAAVPPERTYRLPAAPPPRLVDLSDAPPTLALAPPHTEQVPPRPMWSRHLLRESGVEPPPPSEDEIQDAIQILRVDGFGIEALLYEATAVLDLYGR